MTNLKVDEVNATNLGVSGYRERFSKMPSVSEDDCNSGHADAWRATAAA